MLEIPRPKAAGAQFSPLEHFISVWEPFHGDMNSHYYFPHIQKFFFINTVKGDNLNTPNLEIWNLQTKSAVKSYVQKNHVNWYDEIVLANEVIRLLI